MCAGGPVRRAEKPVSAPHTARPWPAPARCRARRRASAGSARTARARRYVARSPPGRPSDDAAPPRRAGRVRTSGGRKPHPRRRLPRVWLCQPPQHSAGSGTQLLRVSSAHSSKLALSPMPNFSRKSPRYSAHACSSWRDCHPHRQSTRERPDVDPNVARQVESYRFAGSQQQRSIGVVIPERGAG